MTIKTILVPLAGTDADAGALKAAFTVARPFAALVDALFVRIDARDAVPMLGEGMSGAMVEEIMRAAETEANAQAVQARRQFDAAAAAAQAPLAETPPGPGTLAARWRDPVGRSEEMVPQEGRLSDLIVFPHTAIDRDSQSYMTMEATLLSAGRPLLLCPATLPPTIGSTVTIAWNGSTESTRAVTGAMPFLRRAGAVHIISAETSVTRSAVGQRLADYLAWHGIPAQVHPIKPGSRPVGAALLERAGELGSDLFIIGGYGHSRMREMILGGVTRYTFSHAGLPVLMAH